MEKLLNDHTIGKQGHFAMIGSDNSELAYLLNSRLNSPFDKLFIFENYVPNRQLEKINAIVYPGTFQEFVGDFKKFINQKFSFVFIDYSLKDKYRNAYVIRDTLEKIYPYVQTGGLILINNYSDPKDYYLDSVSDSVKGSIDWFVGNNENILDTVYFGNMIGIIKR